MTTILYAEQYERNSEGWILFPSDVQRRAQLLSPESNRHPAKANLFLVEECVKYVSNPGQTVMDVMAGTGTIMVGALIGRSVVAVEISPKFTAIILEGKAIIEKLYPATIGKISVLNAPCQNVMPAPGLADHIIFSPQYASIMKSKGTDKLTSEKTDYDMAEYTYSHPLNLGQMNEFIWTHEMEKIYKKCFETLPFGGTMTLITKDHMKDRLRVPLTQMAIDAAVRCGFSFNAAMDWQKWAAPGSVYTHIYRSRGWEVVEDEDIVTLRKLAVAAPVPVRKEGNKVDFMNLIYAGAR